MVSGQVPYPIKSPMKKLLAHRNEPIPPLNPPSVNVPQALQSTYQQMMAKNPEDRFQSMAAAVAALAP